MVAAVRVHKTGGPDVLTYEDVPVAAPGPGQIKIRNHASGVNFIDTYFRSGMYPSPVGLPFVSGNEGAGEVLAVGPGVSDIKVGDRVGYVSALGAYAAERLLPAQQAAKLPEQNSYEQAARHVRKLRLSVRTDRCLQHQHSADERIAVRHPPDAQHLRRRSRGLAQDRKRPVRRGGARRGQDPREPKIPAEGRAEGAPRSRKPPYHGIEHSAAVIGGAPIAARSADQPSNAREGRVVVHPRSQACGARGAP